MQGAGSRPRSMYYLHCNQADICLTKNFLFQNVRCNTGSARTACRTVPKVQIMERKTNGIGGQGGDWYNPKKKRGWRNEEMD